MELYSTIVSEAVQNCYVYFDKDTKEGVVVDPGEFTDKLKKIIEKNEVNVKFILLTHGHYDHMCGALEMKERYNAPIVSHKLEVAVTNDADVNFTGLRVGQKVEFVADILLEDGDYVTFGEHKLKVIHTPGHTPGCCCYVDEDNGIIFSGDTLFYQTVGRTDLPLSNGQDIVDAINDKLFTLNPEYVVYPGHSRSTTIGHEIKYNPVKR